MKLKILMAAFLTSIPTYVNADSMRNCGNATCGVSGVGAYGAYREWAPIGTKLYTFSQDRFEDYAKKFAGGFDQKLSKACDNGEFGQERKLALYAVFYDGVAGIAALGADGTRFNLADPYGYAKRDQMYFIRHEPYRSHNGQVCEIFKMPNDLKFDPEKVRKYLKEMDEDLK